MQNVQKYERNRIVSNFHWICIDHSALVCGIFPAHFCKLNYYLASFCHRPLQFSQAEHNFPNLKFIQGGSSQSAMQASLPKFVVISVSTLTSLLIYCIFGDDVTEQVTPLPIVWFFSRNNSFINILALVHYAHIEY